jgi:hypothetical protein
MNDHDDRLKAMASNDGQWDLSPKDVAALRWAVERSEVADGLKDACEALLSALIGWADNGEQLAYATQLARRAIARANRTRPEAHP